MNQPTPDSLQCPMCPLKDLTRNEYVIHVHWHMLDCAERGIPFGVQGILVPKDNK